MRVLTAPDTEDPRDRGFTWTLPGELLLRPFICDSGETGACGCERSWTGLGTRKATTLAYVADRPDLSPATYTALIADHLVEARQWPRLEAEAEARALAILGEQHNAGAYLTLDRGSISPLEV